MNNNARNWDNRQQRQYPSQSENYQQYDDNGYYQSQQNGGYYQPQQDNGYYQPQQNGGYYQPQNNNGYYPPQQNAAANKNIIYILIGALIVAIVTIIVILIFHFRSGSGDTELGKNKAVYTTAEKKRVAREDVVINDDTKKHDKEKEAAETTEVTTTTVTTTEPPTETTTTARELSPAERDAQENGYEYFETVLTVRVDEADTLPLRNKPDRYESDVILRIPDGVRVNVYGYKDTGSEIWFRIDYSDTLGWVRGGMLQPEVLDTIYDPFYDRPGLEKWRSKFVLQSPSSESYLGTATFKGTLYFIPDLSSGIQRRYKSNISVDVYSKNGDFYYVEFSSGGLQKGWVHQSQLKW